MARHILLLGGSGFVGSAVLREFLAEEPDTRLSLLVHRRKPGIDAARLRLVHGSLRDFDLNQITRDPPTHVVHMARLPGRSPWRRTLAGLRGARANIRLLQTLRRLAHPPRVLYVSGSLMYGNRGEEWVDEQTPLQPTSFARAYIRGERPLLQSQARGDLPVMMVRPPWILGAGSWFATFYAAPMARQRSVPCYGSGRNWMSLLHVEDCARLIRHVTLHGEAGQSYNLTLPPLRQQDFCGLLSELTGMPVEERPLTTLGRPLDRSLVEAFGSSIRLRSRHHAFLDRCALRFGNPRAALADVIARFEDIKPILPEAPERRAR